jgi:hypothetical protein
MLDQDISGSIAISIDQPTFSGSVQSALDAFATEMISLRIVGVPNWNSVIIQGTGLASVGFFLLNNFNPVTLAEAFQLAFQRKYRDLSEVLIVAFAHVDRLLKVRVVSHNNFTDLVDSAPIDNVPSRLIQIVTDLMIPLVQQSSLAVCQTFNSLQVFNRLQKGIAFVVPLV